MSAAFPTTFREALRDARESRRLHRLCGEVVKRHARTRSRRRAPLRRRAARALELVAPALVPFLVYLGAPLPAFGWLHVWAALVVVTFGARGFGLDWSLLHFSSTAVLRYPSKAGLFLERLGSVLPSLLWIGGCWAAAYAIHLDAALRAAPLAGSLLLLAIVLVPLLWRLGRARAQLTARDESVLAPVVVVSALAFAPQAILQQPELAPVDVFLCVFLGLLVVLMTARIVTGWLRHGEWKPWRLWVDLLSAPRWLVAGGLLVPPAAWAAVPLEWIGYGAFVLIGGGLVLGIWRLVPLLQYAGEDPRSVGMVRTVDEADLDDRPLSAYRLPTRHHGPRSLLRADWFLHARETFPSREELRGLGATLKMLPGIVILSVWHLFGVLLAALAIGRTTPSDVQVLLPVLAALMAPTLLSHSPRHARWLRGADYRQQVWHNLRSLACIAALPTLLAAALSGLVLGWTLERAAVLVLIAGLLACRGGLSGLLNESECDPRPARRTWLLVLLAVTLLAVPRLGLDLPVTWMAWAGAFLLAVGLVGVLLRLVRLDERKLVRAMCASEES